MAISSLVILTFTVLITTWMSGVFGLGGGLILLLVLIHYFDTNLALVIHCLFSIFVCAHRGALNYTSINIRLSLNFFVGYLLAFLILSQMDLSIDKKTVVLTIGFFALSMLFLKSSPVDITKTGCCLMAATFVGTLSMILGSSGPLFNILFLNEKLDKNQVVATKSAISVLTLGLKASYFSRTIPENSELSELIWLVPLFALHGILGTRWAERSRRNLSEKLFVNCGRAIIALTGIFTVFNELL